MTPFERAVNLVLDAEGGYTNDPRDPAGETKFGISKRSYPDENIKTLTRARAEAIYFRDFWAPLEAFEFPEPIAVLLFDMAVNMGKGPAVRCIQRAVGVSDDGIPGPITQKAVKVKFGRDLLVDITAQRIKYYASLNTFSTFGLGWIRRSIRSLLEVSA